MLVQKQHIKVILLEIYIKQQCPTCWKSNLLSKVQPPGLNVTRRGNNGVVPILSICRLGFYSWQVLPRWTGLVLPANYWTLANFSRIWWSLGIAARWMWLVQQMNPILKINGVYRKMLDGRATTESANGQDCQVQSANNCNHL